MSEVLKKLQDPQYWIQWSLRDLYFLNRCVLMTLEDSTPGYKDLYEPTHRRVCDFLQKYSKPGQKIIILNPRGWVKSYCITVGGTVQRILRNLVGGKRERIIISNATLPNAKTFLKKIKYNFQYNPLLQGLFRDYLPKDFEKKAERWTLEDIEIGGNSVEVGSVEGNLVSQHYRVMVQDDLVNLENSKTAEQILKVIDWWKLAQSLLEADGLEIILGTRWMFNDLYGHIIDKFLQIPKDVQEQHRTMPVVEWHNGRYHYLRYICWEDPIAETGSTFPTLFPEARLKEIQLEQGEHFGGQYLNDPLSFADNPFKREWMTTWRERDLPAVRVGFQLLDPQGRETKQSDFTGNVIVEAGSDRRLYVNYARRQRCSDLQAVEWMVQIACLFQPALHAVEEYRFNVFRDLAQFLIPQMIRQGKIPQHLREYASRIPYRMVELKHHNRPKQLRITNLTGYFENGKILLAPSGMDELVEEIVRFKKSERDDILDALAYVLDVVVFPQPQDPVRSFVLPDEMKMTDEEHEKREWEQASEAAYIDQRPIEGGDDELY